MAVAAPKKKACISVMNSCASPCQALNRRLINWNGMGQFVKPDLILEVYKINKVWTFQKFLQNIHFRASKNVIAERKLTMLKKVCQLPVNKAIIVIIT